MTVLAAVGALVIGLVLGVLGGGGSILTVPVLAYAVGLPAKQAIATSLPIVGLASLVGAASHWRQGNAALATAVPFGLATMLGAYAGSRLAGLVSGVAQLALLGVVMLVAAIAMFRGGIGPRQPAAAASERPTRLALLLGVGVAVGLLTGLVGIGGGFLIVPALVLLASLPMHRAVGTSLVVITMTSAAGFAGYLSQGVAVRWGFLLVFAALAVTGILAGSRMGQRLPQATLKRAFAVFLLFMAAFVLWSSRAVLWAS
ncbi:MAG TPA: sulfite exporter TauE/SafE family protein [Gemmatimonadaceae bacterium]|nr:sulfite exporter TauE/SafE family protein [Gemmatimonadaceae bacterium]